ncbi:hypothetical protein GOBAR_AA32521 [Gossypium barbadense]|uniref:Uncharacterized protein n=1 Tax=Gossypium barbadense TaxID=3634 RepID=A0A2P5WAQ4_GOSBA|nr:hypothetical protein GOBAR_AA32521 [Gossypium barbadense]
MARSSLCGSSSGCPEGTSDRLGHHKSENSCTLFVLSKYELGGREGTVGLEEETSPLSNSCHKVSDSLVNPNSRAELRDGHLAYHTTKSKGDGIWLVMNTEFQCKIHVGGLKSDKKSVPWSCSEEGLRGGRWGMVAERWEWEIEGVEALVWSEKGGASRGKERTMVQAGLFG